MQIAADIGTSFFQPNELSKCGLGGFNSNNLKSCEQHKILPESTDPTDFIGAMSPIFLSNKEEEQENDKLKKIAKRIRINLWIFYLSIVVFFGYVSF